MLSGGRTLSYEYDAEERITKVTDSVDGVTQYTYDAMGQLLTETVNGVAVNTMVYDNYGNIVSKNGTDISVFAIHHVGFRAWYYLQHHSKFNYADRPFTTFVEFTVLFSGDLN